MEMNIFRASYSDYSHPICILLLIIFLGLGAFASRTNRNTIRSTTSLVISFFFVSLAVIAMADTTVIAIFKPNTKTVRNLISHYFLPSKRRFYGCHKRFFPECFLQVGEITLEKTPIKTRSFKKGFFDYPDVLSYVEMEVTIGDVPVMIVVSLEIRNEFS
jgi:hypothetical protein